MKWTQVAFSNNGGIRRTLFAGEITMGDIYEILPFDNTLVLMECTGRQVQEIADVIAEKGGAATSGISFKIVDHKAVDVKVAGEPLDLDKMYWMVTNDYLSYGNDYYLPLIYAQDKEMLNVNLRDMAMDYIKSESEKGHKIESSLKKEVYYEK